MFLERNSAILWRIVDVPVPLLVVVVVQLHLSTNSQRTVEQRWFEDGFHLSEPVGSHYPRSKGAVSCRSPTT